MEDLSPPSSRAGRDTFIRKNTAAGYCFFLLQMGANNSSLTPLDCILKNWDKSDPQSLKKTRLIFLCDTAWPQYPLEDSKQWPAGGSLNYNTVLQLDRFCKKQGKWVEVAYVLLFSSLRDMPDLCPKCENLGVKPSAPSCLPTLHPYLGCPAEQAESQGIPLGRVASVSVEIQTESILVKVKTASIENQTASVSVEVQTTPVTIRPRSTLVSIETQTVEVKKAQTIKANDKI